MGWVGIFLGTAEANIMVGQCLYSITLVSFLKTTTTCEVTRWQIVFMNGLHIESMFAGDEFCEYVCARETNYERICCCLLLYYS